MSSRRNQADARDENRAAPGRAHPNRPNVAAIAQGCNVVRKELGLKTIHVPAADPALQTDMFPKGCCGAQDTLD